MQTQENAREQFWKKAKKETNDYRRNVRVDTSFFLPEEKISDSLTGIEPMTLWLPVRRVTQWATRTHVGNGSLNLVLIDRISGICPW